ncbi:MAG: YpdA family putative bacillithiol disulfide reductase [Acidobacteria bacterium]|nr:YpdA family putative bacillithiol disulfide reductase [Acidobacteriota bacterium]
MNFCLNSRWLCSGSTTKVTNSAWFRYNGVLNCLIGQDIFDVLVIGAGPTGLACAIEARRAGFTAVNLDKGCLVNSLCHYPVNMTFFTTPELLEIGDIPFTTSNQKPSRLEALEYYRKVAAHYSLDVRQYQAVGSIEGCDGEFRVTTRDRYDGGHEYAARKLVIATGFYDRPNLLKVPGEDLPKVLHYYNEPHPYFDTDVIVVGGRNSAAIAALELWRHGARVTLVHRGPGIHERVKYWIRPDILNRIKNGEVKAYFNSAIQAITPAEVLLHTPQGDATLKNDFVLAMTGYHPDFDFLRRAGIELGPECRPACNSETLESNVPGIYLAGVIIAGVRTGEIFIENGRFHGAQIAGDLKRKLRPHVATLQPEPAPPPRPAHLQSAE